jgi:hypothetical protein
MMTTAPEGAPSPPLTIAHGDDGNRRPQAIIDADEDRFGFHLYAQDAEVLEGRPCRDES